MKTILILLTCLLLFGRAKAQQVTNDQSMRYQEQRMVFRQWDQNKFTPTSGFLGLNPYYWLTWGWFYPNYHKTDLRPLSATGPQTQRLALVAAMNGIDNSYKLQSDTLRNIALSQIAEQSGALTDADPLWFLYYADEFKPVLNYSMASLLAGLSTQVRAKLISEGSYTWYTNELERLKQRIQGAHTADMDRGARIMAYFRLLREYKKISGVWAVRTSSAANSLNMASQQQKLQNGQLPISGWSAHTDITIAGKVLKHLQ